MSVINLKNYRRGLIKGYELAYQDPEWYRKNKDNFCISLKEKYSYMIPEYAKKSPSKNYLGFLPTDLIRFGKLEKMDLNIEGKNFSFWIVNIPEGFNLYHSSRALGLNHSDFPLIGYENKKSVESNRKTSENICPAENFIGKSPQTIGDVCTYVSYYSTPYLTKEYLRKDNGFGGNSIKYAYGIGTTSKDKNNRRYNDRLRYNVNSVKDGQIKISESDEGVSAYKNKGDMKLFIFGLDDILINRPNLGKENLKTFYTIMELLRNKINIDDITFERFLDLIKSTGGIGSLQDNVDTIIRDYPGAKNFEEGLKQWLKRNYDHYKEDPLKTAGIIRDFYKEPKNIPGFRFSTYEHDRVVINMLSWLFGKYSKEKIYGFTSSSLYVYSKGKGDVTSGKLFQVNDLTFYSSRGYFHSELGLFFAPDILERDRNNKYDLEYNINYLGILQEYRKFKTENLAPNGFHQGHLLEHNSWVSLVAGTLREKYLEYNSDKIANKNIYLLAGFLHDLGKSGNCDVKAVYRNLNPQEAFMSVCHFEKDETERVIGMKYHSLPAHPSEGYEYLKGYKPYKMYTLGDKIQNLYLQDWEKYFDHLNIDKYNRRLIRIAVGAHWYFGYYLDKFVKSNSAEKYNLIKDYVRRIECFYNDEFFKLDRKDFRNIVTFVVIISIADVLGSEYNPLLENDKLENNGLTEDERNTIMNYLPNISLSDVDLKDNRENNVGNKEKIVKPSSVINKIIEKSIENTEKAFNKKEIFRNLRDYSGTFLDGILKYIDSDFNFTPSNSYSILFNLQNSYTGIGDIHRSYPESMPKVIAFDLDQTLLATKFFSNKPVEYSIYEDTYKIIAECQELRKGILEEDGSRKPNTKIFIALTTRHYAPKTLKALLFKEKIEVNGEFLQNPIYYKNFDLIVSKYTGKKEYLYSQVEKFDNFFLENGDIDEGFLMDDNGENYNIPHNSKFLDVNEISKAGHYNLLKKKYNIEYGDILAYDDDSKYFKEGNMKGLGESKDVYVAAALPKDEGLKYSLFRDGLCFYIFDKLKGFRSY